jgi:drug/metabolite transporter (DMT)-like permease
LFNELPSTSTYIGAGMIILSSLIIFRREQGKKITTTITRQI